MRSLIGKTVPAVLVWTFLAVVPQYQAVADKQAVAGHKQIAQRMLNHSDILGRWCGQVSTYVLSRTEFLLIRYADGERFRFLVRRYEFTTSTVTLYWSTQEGKNYNTLFRMSPGSTSFFQPAGKHTYRRC